MKKVWAAGSGNLDLPYKLNFILTKECHSRCVNCNIWKKKPENELTFEEIEKFCKNNSHFSWVNFTGGEPTDRKDFPEVVGLFAKHNKDLRLVHFPTNGLKPDHIANTAKKISDQLKAHNKKAQLIVTVSIDGPPKINDQLRGIQGDFDLAIETFKKLTQTKNCKVFVGMTLFPSNQQHIESTFESIKEQIPEFTHESFHVNLAHVSGHYYENDIIKNTTRESMIEHIREYRKKRGLVTSAVDWMENEFFKLSEEYIKTGKTPIDCEALKSSVFLTETGTVYPCSIWGKPLGNIREVSYSLKPLLENDLTNQVKKMISQKKCANCWTPCEAFQSIAANKINPLAKFKKKKQAA